MILETLIEKVLQREGGYINHPSDRGGPTNFGITLKTLSRWRETSVTALDVESIAVDEARDIYRSEYWNKPGFARLSNLHPLIVEMLFDMGVNHGTNSAVRMLQRAVGTKDDGILGPKTIASIAEMETRELGAHLMAERVIEYGRIITKNNTQAAFAHGWMRRAAEFISRLGNIS